MNTCIFNMDYIITQYCENVIYFFTFIFYWKESVQFVILIIVYNFFYLVIQYKYGYIYLQINI